MYPTFRVYRESLSASDSMAQKFASDVASMSVEQRREILTDRLANQMADVLCTLKVSRLERTGLSCTMNEASNPGVAKVVLHCNSPQAEDEVLLSSVGCHTAYHCALLGYR